jgi:peptidoglycan/LPS O-acetylase OafA/YrhL
LNITAPRRITFLDSSRGIAALVVLIAHFQLSVLPGLAKEWIFKTPLGIIFDAEAAVLYFFVLSGYVLTKSLDNSSLRLGGYATFVLKRILRIFPAFLFVLFLTTIVLVFVQPPPESWLGQFWMDRQGNIWSVFKQAILIKRFPNEPELRILPHDWTLSIEMGVSLLLPVLAYSARLSSILTLLLIYFSVKFLNLDPFTFDFTLGIFIAQNNRVFQMHSGKTKLVLFLAAFILICTDYFAPRLMSTLDHLIIHHKGWGVAILLFLVLSSVTAQRILQFKPFNFLGKISYSFYLLHMVILLVMINLMPGIHWLLFLVLYLLATVILSTITFIQVEKPFITAGKNLS